ncbi:hypothetical protein D3273_12135 [Lichenibacterium minor]|uniref:Uncharacterized protein n=1 Tax=Lichenibacterium minor TaxID=2316528 RepID=A0A4Q2U9Q5_9HYPH|nr:hypothetical protein [Lichenibacterium minor]RYC31625.1 hypothetical protein D3273_12135 [Lichenibacterium minor]
MSKTIKLAAAAAALFAALPLGAEAMPIAPAASADAGMTLVAGGCGPGFHRGPFLGCRPNRFVGRPFVRPFVRRPVICRTVLLPLPHRVCR